MGFHFRFVNLVNSSNYSRIFRYSHPDSRFFAALKYGIRQLQNMKQSSKLDTQRYIRFTSKDIWANVRLGFNAKLQRKVAPTRVPQSDTFYLPMCFELFQNLPLPWLSNLTLPLKFDLSKTLILVTPLPKGTCPRNLWNFGGKGNKFVDHGIETDYHFMETLNKI